MSDDRRSGLSRRHVEDFYDLIEDQDVRESELQADYVDSFVDEGATVADLAGQSTSWRYGHVIVDEAQELSPMAWRMLRRRCVGNGFTIVGDLAQRSNGTTSHWDELLSGSFSDFNYRELTVNYRSPSEINDLCVAIWRRLNLDVAESTGIRSVPGSVRICHTTSVQELASAIEQVCAETQGDERVLLITDPEVGVEIPEFENVAHMSDDGIKGLEFDHVVVSDSDRYFNDGVRGLQRLYVCCSRATKSVTLAHKNPLPEWLIDTFD